MPETVTESADDVPAGTTTTYAYDDAGRVVQVTDARGGKTFRRYDIVGRLIGEISPSTGQARRLAKRLAYNPDDQVLTEDSGTVPEGQDGNAALWDPFALLTRVTNSYDARTGDKIQSAISTAAEDVTGVTQYSHDAVGRLECTAIRMNPAVYGALPASACVLGTAGAQGQDRITKNVYDAAGRLLKVQKAYGVTTANGFPVTLQQDYATYTYSLNGKQTSVIDANGNKATMTYDGFDRQIAWYVSLKGEWDGDGSCTIGTITTVNGVTGPSEARGANDDCEKYAYDANGNRAKLMKRDGQVIRYNYDALNRVTLKDIPGGTTKDVYYGYDLHGLQTYARFEAANGDGINTVYDGFGRVTSSTSTMGGVSRTLGYQYDPNGNRTRVTHPDGTFFTYEYDGLNRPLGVRENGTTVVATMAGTRKAPLGETRGVVNTTYGYDAISRLTSIADDLAGTANDLTTSFGYNPANQIVSRTQSNRSMRSAAIPTSIAATRSTASTSMARPAE